jgi:tRNA pseudouridine55 synthase
LLQYLPTDKVYQALIRLGVTTTTDDLEGEILQTQSVPPFTELQLIETLQSFIGRIQQVPPTYSAIQVQGQRLYHLARQGKVVDVPVREVDVYSIEMLDWQPDTSDLTVRIACGGGTYIRAIARDVGEKLNCGGTLAQLIRLKSCGFELSQSLTLEDVAEKITKDVPVLTDSAQGIQHLPACILDPQFAKRWCLGQTVAVQDAVEGVVRVEDQEHSCLGVGEVAEQYCHPKVVLTPANGKDG